MNAHDVERIEGDIAYCACGEWSGPVAAHETHFQIERARAALRGEREESRGA